MKEYLNSQDTALIIVDLQNDFFHEEGSTNQAYGIDIKSRHAIVPQIKALIERSREIDIPVIFIQMTLDESTVSEPMKIKGGMLGHVRKGTWGSEFYKLFPQEGDIVVEKHRFSAFIGTNLNLVLHSLNRKSIVLIGALTNICVESTARDGFMMDYNVTVVKDGCSGSSQEMHEASLSNLGRSFGLILETSDVLDYWSQVNT